MNAVDKLFRDSEGADFIGEGACVFYNPTLVVDIGEHKAGTKFDRIMVDPDNSRLVLQKFDKDGTFKDELEFIYELEYQIGKSVK